MSDQREVRLGDVADLNWGDTKTTKASYVPHGFRAFSASGPDGWLPWADYDRIGVVVSAIGADCGKTWLVKGKWSCIKNTIRFFSSDPNVDTEYLYWATRDPGMWPRRGSAQPFISQGDARNIRLTLPSFAEQRAIAGVLGALDDKIESNRRISATARSLCDAVFEADTDTEERLSAVSVVTMGSSPPGDTYNSRGDGLPFYQGVTDFGFLSPSRRVWTSNPIRIAEAGSTLISVRAPVGKLNEASEKCCIGRGVASASSENQTVLYYALRKADAVWAPFESEGTVFGSINRSDLEGAKIPWISGSKIDQVEADLRAIHGRVRAAVAEIVTLEQVRDALLPELLSGRLRVPDAEKVVEGAL